MSANNNIFPTFRAGLVAVAAVALCCAGAAAETLPPDIQADSCRKESRIISRVGFDARAAYIAGARAAVEDHYSGSPEEHLGLAGHLKYSFSYSDATRQGRLYPGAYQGIGLSVSSFLDGNKSGTPVTAYLFQGAPIVRIARNLTFDYEWNFGASFGWKKYHEDWSNYESCPPLNLIVGSPVNAYINVGFLLNYRLSPRWNVAAGIDMTHYSNGNTSWPNPGVNMLGARVGLTYTFDSDPHVRTLADNADVEPIKPHISYDLVAYGAVRKKMLDLNGSEVLPGHFGIAGINFAPMWNFNRFLRAGVSADIQYDESSNLKKYWIEGTYGDDVRFRRPPFFHQVSAGLSARGELVMPIFSINAGLGYNIAGNSDSKNFYQVLALKVHVAGSFFVHIGYQLNSFRNPNNLMIGVGYRFHDKR